MILYLEITIKEKKQFQQESMESEVLIIVSNAVSFSFVIISYTVFKRKMYIIM